MHQVCKACHCPEYLRSRRSTSPETDSPVQHDDFEGVEALVLLRTHLDEEDAAALGRVVGARDEIPSDEGVVCTLRALVLSNNALSDRGARALSLGLARNRRLERVEIMDNCIGNDGARAVLQACTGHAFGVLSLADNRISCEGARWTAPLLEGCKFLRELTLSGNSIANAGATSIAHVHPISTPFVTCSVKRARKDHSSESVGRSQGLTTNKSIERLNLNGNRISDDGTEPALRAPRCEVESHLSQVAN
jgi:hypothetical protein